MLQFVGLLWQWIQAPPSLDRTVKFHSGFNNSTSDQIKNSEVVRDVDFDAADNYCLYVTTMKPMNFQDGIPSIPNDNFKEHNVISIWVDFNPRGYWKLSIPGKKWRTTEAVDKFYFSPKTLQNSLYWENECLRLPLTNVTSWWFCE